MPKTCLRGADHELDGIVGHGLLHAALPVSGVGAPQRLLVFVGYCAIGFHDYYARPAWSVDVGAGKTMNEDEILRLADAAAPQYDRYVRYWQFGGLTLTVLLGITTAIFARWQNSIGHGIGALAAGAFVTSAALHLMPFRYFAFDQYPLGFLWLFQLPLAVLCFALTLFLFRSPFFVHGPARNLHCNCPDSFVVARLPCLQFFIINPAS